jgi:hypothetical protein
MAFFHWIFSAVDAATSGKDPTAQIEIVSSIAGV